MSNMSLRARVNGRVVPNATNTMVPNPSMVPAMISNVGINAAPKPAMSQPIPAQGLVARRVNNGGRPVLGDISNNMNAPVQNDAAPKKRIVVVNNTEVVQQADEEMPDAHQYVAPVQQTHPEVDMVESAYPVAPVTMAMSSSVSVTNNAFAAAPRAAEPPCVHDLYRYYLEVEALRSPSPKYMSKQTDINAKMRTILINWLVEVHRKFRLKSETLFLSINILDRFLERKAVSRSKLQLVGVGALLIASKFEEIYAPEVNELVEMTDNAYTRDEVLQVECIMLNTLQFELTVPTPFFFAQRYLQAAENSEELYHLAFFLLELCLLDYKMLKWLPSVSAASALYLSRRMLGLPIWTSQLEAATGYSEQFIRNCVLDIQQVLTVPDPKEEAVRRKYSSPKYKSVGKIPPCAI